MLSNKQSEFLSYLVAEAKRGREFPTFQEMVDDGASPGRSNAHNMISRLVELGMVQRIEGSHRRPYRVTARGVAYVDDPQGVQGDPVAPEAILAEARRDGIRAMSKAVLETVSNFPIESRELFKRQIMRCERRALDRVESNA